MHERKCRLVLLLGLGVLGAAASPSEKPADSTRASLRHFVRTTHWDEKSPPLTMPNPSLTDSQIADVVSYILSLRKWMQRRSVATMVCFAYFAYFAYFAVILSHRLLVGVARPRGHMGVAYGFVQIGALRMRKCLVQGHLNKN